MNIIKRAKVLKTVGIVVVVSCISACASNYVGVGNVTKTIQIEYGPDVDGLRCPSRANETTTVSGKVGDNIKFVSAINEKFTLSFDPFKNSKHNSNGRGELTLRLSGTALLPVGENGVGQLYKFKYLILAKGCPPIDPMIIIDR